MLSETNVTLIFTRLLRPKRESVAQKLVWLVSGLGMLIASTASLAEESVRGLVKPKNEAVISSEIAARVLRIPFRSGEAFERDETLVAFDCSLYQAQLAAAEAGRDAIASRYRNASEMLEYKAASAVDVEVLRSELRQAEANVDIENLRVERCQIRAPYSGRVVSVSANEFESVNPQDPLLAVLSDERLEIELIVPSAWLQWLSPGQGFAFSVDETGATYDALVSRVGAMVDPISQTVQVIGQFEQQEDNILSGMSGSALFYDQNRDQRLVNDENTGG